MERLRPIIIIAIIALFARIVPLFANSEQGNRGPIYLSTAWNLKKGDLVVHGNSRFYFNNKTFYNPNSSGVAVTFWDVQGGINMYYGIGHHYQLGISQIVYQDNHKPGR